jgi:serine/threonine protein kinase
MLNTGIILQKRYRVVRPLGRGGMGAVYEAFDERLSRTVALKETSVETEELRRAFGREARLLANLRHPALPKVLDHFDEGGLFLVMEFIPGDDLGRMLELGRRFTPGEVLGWADQLLDALGYLHGLDPPVLHRDVKPSNLKLVSTGHVVLLDFGLAKGRAGQMEGTGSTSLLGYSPAYSPLEQMQGSGTDERSDLYSLGATLYHLLTGVGPTDALARAAALVNGQPDPLRPPHLINQGVGTNVSAALMRAMALDIGSRPRTASEMRALLHDAAHAVPHTVAIAEGDETTRVSAASARVVAPAAVTDLNRRPDRSIEVPVPEETWVSKRQAGAWRRWRVGAAALAGLFALSAVFYLYLSGGRSKRVAPVNPPVVGVSPPPTPIPTPAESPAQQPGSDSAPFVGPDELAARERLAQKKIPFSEETFTRAVEEGDTGAVELLLAAGMSPDVKDGAGRTALITAAARGRNHVSRELLSRGADVNARDSDGSTALMQSALAGHQETTDVLLRSGADVNLSNNQGQTALILAAARGHADIVRKLLGRGAVISVRDRNGRDALSWAEANNRSEVADLLRRARGARP